MKGPCERQPNMECPSCGELMLVSEQCTSCGTCLNCCDCVESLGDGDLLLESNKKIMCAQVSIAGHGTDGVLHVRRGQARLHP